MNTLGLNVNGLTLFFLFWYQHLFCKLELDTCFIENLSLKTQIIDWVSLREVLKKIDAKPKDSDPK